MKIFKADFWGKTGSYGSFEPYWGKVIAGIIAGIVILTILATQFPFGTVGAGERGVKLRFSAVTGTTVGEGLYFRIPFVERVVIMDVKTQKEEVNASAASKDLQTVNAVVALNYSINPESVVSVYQNIGIDYKIRIIDPAIQEAVKASTAKFTAEELITKREAVGADIKTHLSDRLTPHGIRTEGFSIINFDFSGSFNQAIEAKVTAEQNALASKNKLEQIKYEKEQAIVSAQGRAEALRIESAAISSNPEVLELRAIEKWNGILPTTTGGAIPFLNIR